MEGTVARGPIRDRFNELATVRASTIAFVSALAQEQLDFSPRAGRWSVGEIADHLRLSEMLWRGEMRELVGLARAGQPTYIRRSMSDINVAPVMIPDAVMSMLEVPFGIMTRFIPDAVVGMMLEFPLLPMRNPDGATPRAGRSREELVRELTEALDFTRRLIDDNADLDFESMVSWHPLMGANNVPQMLTLLARHERRHQTQMERVKADARFPAR